LVDIPEPSKILAYLIRSNWIIVSTSDKWMLFSRFKDGVLIDIDLPIADLALDYKLRIQEFFLELASIEDRPISDILIDML
jgi:hypothetical protein